MSGSIQKNEKKEKEKKTHLAMKLVGVIPLAAFVIIMTGTFTTANIPQAYATTNDRRAQSEIIDVSGEIVDSSPCENAELIELSGDLHVVDQIIIQGDSEEPFFHIVQHANFQGVTGEGQTTGADYRVPNAAGDTLNFNVRSGSGEATVTTSFHLVSQGESAQDILVTAIFRVTVANGEVTTEIANLRAECR